MNTHTSTHIDAAQHHFPDGWDVAQIPVDLLVGSAIVIDLFDIPAHTAISMDHLQPYADKIKEGDIVLLCTGFGQKRGWNKDYVDNWPFLSEEGAQFLYDKKVKGIAIDAMSVGGPRAGEGLMQHELLLRDNIWLGEEFYFPKEILEYERWEVVFLPLKLENCGGAPGRAIAFVLDE